MTLEEMQHVWSEMTDKLDQQEQLTHKLIIDMTKEKFKNKIAAIARYETIGAIVCFVAALLLVIHIGKLDTWYLMASGIIVFTYLTVVPGIVLWHIGKMRGVDLQRNTFKQSLIEFTASRKQFLFWQRTVVVSNFFLMVLILPVFSKLFKDKDLFIEQPLYWLWYMIVMLIVLIPFSFWGYRKYSKMTESAGNLLRDLRS